MLTSPRAVEPRRLFSASTDCRAPGKEPAPGDILEVRFCRSRGAYVLRHEPERLGPARRYLRRQNPERHEARRSARGATNEVRAGGQLENRQADWSYGSTKSVARADK